MQAYSNRGLYFLGAGAFAVIAFVALVVRCCMCRRDAKPRFVVNFQKPPQTRNTFTDLELCNTYGDFDSAGLSDTKPRNAHLFDLSLIHI